MPAWHLDFRNAEGLPDTKPIRTSFFINGLALLVAAAVVLLFVHREVKLYNLSAEIAQVEEQIAQNSGPSAEAVRQFREFQAAEKKLREVAAFTASPIRPSVFLRRLGAILPDKVKFDAIDIREGNYTLRGSVAGTLEEASGTASGLVDLLNRDEVISPLFDDAMLTNVTQNPATGLLAMEIQMKVTPPAKP